MSVISIQTKKMGDLQTVTEVAKTDLLIVHDGSGMKTVTMDDFVGKDMDVLTAKVTGFESKIAPLIYDGVAHNGIYRGKYLGTSVTAAQYAAISAGTFEDLYIGDYWTIEGVVYRIAAFDYYYNVGDTNCTTHHVTVVPDTCLYNAQMNTSNVTTGAYVGSAMYTSNLAKAKSTINSAFGSAHVLNHRVLLANAISGDAPSGFIWYDSTVELMSESQVYGMRAWGGAAQNGYSVASQDGQLPLFALRHDLIHNRDNYWLQDVRSAAAFAIVSNIGYAFFVGATYSLGVRPAFCIS